MAHEATLCVLLADEAAAAAVHQALAPEAAQGPDGSTTRLRRDGAHLVAELTASDLSTLRAAVNSVVRLLDTAQRSIA